MFIFPNKFIFHYLLSHQERQSTSKAVLDVEEEELTVDRSFKCDVCESSFKKKENIRSHVRTHFKFKSFKCEKCEKTFKRRGDLRFHMKQIHYSKRNLKCSDCGKAFNTKSCLKKHQKSHISERKLKCEICQKVFKTNRDLKQHQTFHEMKKFACTECEKNSI